MAAPALQPVRRAVKRFVQWVNTYTGYTEDQLRGGLQVLVGLFILMATCSAPTVWNALTLADAAIIPTYAIVTFCVVLQPNLGTASQFVVMRVVGAVVGGLLGLICMYVTYGANGGTYSASLTKGAVMVTLLAFFAFLLNLFRFRHPRFWFAFVVGTFSMPMVALNSYWLDFVEYKALFYWWLQIALGVGVAALVSTFVVPITAGSKVRRKTQDVLRQLGSLTTAILEEMLAPRLGPDGLLLGVKGTLEGPNLTDSGLTKEVAPLFDLANAIATNIESVRSLLRVVPTEYDVYSRTHVFPTEAYDLLKLNTRAFLSSLMMLLYPLQSGKLSLRGVQAYEREVRLAGACLGKSMEQLAGCIDSSVEYRSALHSLRELEHQWHKLGTLCPSPEDGWSENDLLAMDMVLASLFSLGTRVRRMYLAMPDAIHIDQPGCRAWASRHFKSSAVWDMAPAAGSRSMATRALRRTGTPLSSAIESELPSPRQLLSPRAARLVAAQQHSQFLRVRSQARLDTAVKAGEGGKALRKGGPSAASLKQLADGGNVEEAFPVLMPLPPIVRGLPGTALEWVRQHTGFNSLQICLALQLAVGLAVASVLHVDRGTYDALQQKTIWVVVTVCVIFESSLGGIMLKSAMRIIGTVLAGLLGVGLLYWAVLLNGGDYENNPAKFITMSIFLPLVGGAVMMNHMRVPHQYAYALSVCKFTMPIIALSGYAGTRVAWQTALWRLCNILTGIAIDLAATSLMFPVTTRRATRHKIQETLADLADVSQRVINSFVSGPSLLASSPLGSPRRPLSRTSTMDGASPLHPSSAASRHMSQALSQAPSQQSPQQQQQQQSSPAAASDIEMGQLQQSPREALASEAAGGRLWQQALGTLEQHAPAGGHAARELQALSLAAARELEALSLAAATPFAGALRQVHAVPHAPPPQQQQQQGGAAASAGGSPAGSQELPRRLPSALDLVEQHAQQAPQPQLGTPDPPPPLLGSGHPSARDLVVLPAAPHGCDPVPDEPGHSGSLAGEILLQVRPPQQPPPREAFPPASGDGASGAAGGWPLMASATTGESREVLLGPRRSSLEGSSGQDAGALPQGSPVSPAVPEAGVTARVGVAAGRVAPPSPDRQRLQLPPLHIPRHHGAQSPTGGSGPVSQGSSGTATPLATQRTHTVSSNGFLSHTPTNRKVRRQRTAWLQRHVLGRVFVTIHEESQGVAEHINELGELALFAKYEWIPLSQGPRLQPEDIRAAQRSCRKMLNVLLSFAYVLDAPDIPHLRLLTPHTKEVQTIAAQMQACLKALSHVVGGHLSMDNALAMVGNLALQVQLLLLEVEQGGMPAGASDADVVLGYASLGVLFSAMQTVHLLFQAVAKLLGTPEELAAVERSFQQTAAWGASMEALLVAQGVVLSHLATEATEEEEFSGLRMAD